MSEPSVLVSKQGRAGRLTLNRAKSLHALNLDMCMRMTSALMEWRDDPEVELVIVDHTEGTRGFCAGGDIVMLQESGKSDGKEGAAFFACEYRLNTLIKEYPKPYVSIIDGVTMGGGVGISAHGTYRVATERTLFAMPETGIGLFPDVGGGYFLPRLSGELGTWIALTGARLKGEDVLALGVATHFTASEGVADLTTALCEKGVAALEPLKQRAEGSYADNISEIDSAFAHDRLEDIIAALNGGSDWAKSVADTLSTKSPLSMKVTLRQLRLGGQLEFRDVMRMELRVGARMIQTENFQEGVRAVLIDRDNAPNWKPKTIGDVSDDLVSTFFEPLGENELTFLETN